MRVLFYSNIPSPYRVDFYNELGKKCDLTVLFELHDSSERDEKWQHEEFRNFRGIYLKGKRLTTDSAFCPEITKYFKRKYDAIVFTVLASPTALWAASYLRRNKIPYYFEGDGGFIGSTRGIKAAWKRFIISGAKGCFSTSVEFDRYCEAYGAGEERIFRYPFTSVRREDVLTRPLTRSEKQQKKQELGILEEKMVISVGQFIERKGFDLLLRASKNFPEGTGLYIIGGDPTEEYKDIVRQLDLQGVHFVPFMSAGLLREYYRAADVFAFFTREDIWGLVVNEAMANGLPVVSTDRCIAATELIHNGENGYVISMNDVAGMSTAVGKILENPEICREMSQNALKEISEHYTIENMAEEHVKILMEECRCTG